MSCTRRSDVSFLWVEHQLRHFSTIFSQCPYKNFAEKFYFSAEIIHFLHGEKSFLPRRIFFLPWKKIFYSAEQFEELLGGVKLMERYDGKMRVELRWRCVEGLKMIGASVAEVLGRCSPQCATGERTKPYRGGEQSE